MQYEPLREINKSKNCFVVLFTSNSNNVHLVRAEGRFSVCSKMFPEIELDFKRRQELVALIRLRLLKLGRLKLEAALTMKKWCRRFSQRPINSEKEDHGRIEKPHEEI